ncbi:MAG: hypothetical protein NTX52_13400 [Planctomycetota bacterium]|nr:hypothetical protein [Planctomycetota bacterium]
MIEDALGFLHAYNQAEARRKRKDLGMKIGDHINVHFTSSPSLFNVEILSMPSCAGDCWLLKGTDGSIYNVMVFEQMHQFSKAIESGQSAHSDSPPLSDVELYGAPL